MLSRPHITCLMECSVDGRIDRNRWSTLYKSDEGPGPDLYYKTLNSLNPDGNLLGLKTVRNFFGIPEFENKKRTEVRDPHFFRGIRDEVMMTAVFDGDGTLAYRRNKRNGSNIIAILGAKTASEEYLRYLREHEISYTFAGDDGTDPEIALCSLLNDFGLRNLVLEGGGSLNGSFLERGLIDELVLVIYPGLDGMSSSLSIFEIPAAKSLTPGCGHKLELVSCDHDECGFVSLHYKVH
jgi:riboflavin biosynthesis pyrimidine reductase